jgi:hypothetical protein
MTFAVVAILRFFRWMMLDEASLAGVRLVVALRFLLLLFLLAAGDDDDDDRSSMTVADPCRLLVGESPLTVAVLRSTADLIVVVAVDFMVVVVLVVVLWKVASWKRVVGQLKKGWCKRQLFCDCEPRTRTKHEQNKQTNRREPMMRMDRPHW